MQLLESSVQIILIIQALIACFNVVIPKGFNFLLWSNSDKIEYNSIEDINLYKTPIFTSALLIRKI